MTPLASKFLSVLSNHKGLRNALSVQEMARQLGFGSGKSGTRRAQILKRALVDAGHLIGSSCQQGHSGWYEIETEEEFEATLKQYKSRFFSSSQLVKRHYASWKRRESPQMVMF